MSGRYNIDVISDDISEQHEPLQVLVDENSLPLRSFGFTSPMAFHLFLDDIANDERYRWPDLILFRDDLDREYIFHCLMKIRGYGDVIWTGVLALRMDADMERQYRSIGCCSYLAADDLAGVRKLILALAGSKAANEVVYPYPSVDDDS